MTKYKVQNVECFDCEFKKDCLPRISKPKGKEDR
jgi:hypothetical protein